MNSISLIWRISQTILFNESYPTTLFPGPSNGETCENEDDESTISRGKYSAVYRRFQRIRRRIVGAKERIQYGRLDGADVECQDGTVCVEGVNGTKKCLRENLDSKCV